MFENSGHRIAISTNGFVKLNGEAVMGRGCAKQAAERFPKAPKKLGDYLTEYGNTPGYLEVSEKKRLMILPVKQNWWERASLELVNKSVDFLKEEALRNKNVVFHVPRLGCGNGQLSWEEDVGPLMRTLPSNVVVHYF